jgi:anti-sigma factor RsiW
MGCKPYKEILTDAALGALEPSRETEFAAHLARCEACRAALDRERHLLAAINFGIEASVAAEPSPEFLARMRRRLEEEQLPMRLWFSGWVPIAVGALAALALVTVWIARRSAVGPVATETAQTAPSQQPLATKGNSATEKVRAELESLPGGHATRQLTTRATDPRALAPPGEQAAVLRLYEAVQKRSIDTASLLASPVPSEPSSLEFAPLEVASLEIRPMPPERGPDH